MGTLFSDLCNLVHDESGTVQNGGGALALNGRALFWNRILFPPGLSGVFDYCGYSGNNLYDTNEKVVYASFFCGCNVNGNTSDDD